MTERIDREESAQRALAFCDRALDQLDDDEPRVDEAVLSVEGIRTELTAILSDR